MNAPRQIHELDEAVQNRPGWAIDVSHLVASLARYGVSLWGNTNSQELRWFVHRAGDRVPIGPGEIRAIDAVVEAESWEAMSAEEVR